MAGNPLTGVTASFTERGRTVTKVVAPTTLAMARSHFGCPTLNGAELENDGGNGTALSHWEARIFQGEAMVRQHFCDLGLRVFIPVIEDIVDKVQGYR